MTNEQARKHVSIRLAGFIGSDLDDANNRANLARATQVVVAELKYNGFTVLADYSPYYEFVGLLDDGDNLVHTYQQRRF